MIDYTQLKNHERKILREVIPLPKPFTLVVEPTNICNFRCTQCFQSISLDNYFTRNKQEMSLECYRKIIEEAKNWDGNRFKVLKISLFGEPLLSSSFIDMLRIAQENNIAERIETTSNVSLLTEEIAEAMVRYGMDYLRVSIYSPIQEKHEQITGNPISIGKIYQNLDQLQKIKRKYGKKKPFVAVKMLDTFSSENEIFLKMYADVADELYLDQPHNWIAVEEKNFVESLYGNDYKKAQKILSEQRKRRIACSNSFFTMAVRSNGDVNPCCVDWLGNTWIGNVLEENLRDIWQGTRLLEFWKMQLEGRKQENASCKNCEFYLSNYYTKDDVDGFPVEKLKWE